MAGIHNDEERKIIHFLDYIRNHYKLKTDSFSDEFITALSERSGISRDRVSKVVACIKMIQQERHISGKELGTMNRRIGEFYKDDKIN